jgi:tripartite-type tricarboxylate transporter receptor subunit TctC
LAVHPALLVNSLAELVALAKQQPGLSFATGGGIDASYMAVQWFARLLGVSLEHVANRGGAPAIPGLLGGYVQVIFGAVPESIEYIRAGQLRPLAVTTRAPLDVLPGIPPLSDFLPGYEAGGWQGIGAPKNTPAEIIDKVNKEINFALADPKLKARLSDLGGTVIPGSPTDFRKLIADETESGPR